MLGLDYVKETILDSLDTMTSEEIADELGMDVLVVMSFQIVKENEMPFGDALSIFDMVKFYEAGLTYSEVSYLKGITKEGIRLAIDRIIGNRKPELKQRHLEVRNEIRDRILRKRIIEMINRHGEDEARKKLGYSKGYFKIVCNRIEEGDTCDT